MWSADLCRARPQYRGSPHFHCKLKPTLIYVIHYLLEFVIWIPLRNYIHFSHIDLGLCGILMSKSLVKTLTRNQARWCRHKTRSHDQLDPTTPQLPLRPYPLPTCIWKWSIMFVASPIQLTNQCFAWWIDLLLITTITNNVNFFHWAISWSFYNTQWITSTSVVYYC